MRIRWPRLPATISGPGGTLAPGNKAFACQPCNTDKGSRSLRQWLRRLEIDGDPRAVFVRALTGLR